MSGKLLSSSQFPSCNTSKLGKFFQIIEGIIIFCCIALTITFVFTGVMVKHDLRWWIGIVICSIMWSLAIWKHSRLSIEQISENDNDTKTIFLCILFAGFAIRFVLAVIIMPVLQADCESLYAYANEWSKGNFIETKTLFQTAFYAFWQWLAGPSLQWTQIINAILGSLQIAIAFDLAKRIFKRGYIALAAAALTAFHPIFIILTLGIYTELLFGILMLLSFRSFVILNERIEEQLYDKQSVFESVKLALCCLALFYTRGNGAFMILLCWFLLLLAIKFSKQGIVKIFLPNLITTISIMIIVGLLNIKILGHFVVSSSEDSYWPMLFGSCVESNGIWCQSDIDLIKSQYFEAHPELKGSNVHKHELIPFIKKEFHRRWHENTLEMINLSISKYERMWGNNDYWISFFLGKNEREVVVRKWDLIKYPTMRFKQIGAVCLVCWLILLPGMSASSRRTVLLILLFLFLNVINHLFVEALERYSYPLTVTLSILAPGIFLFRTSFKSEKQLNKKEITNE